MADKNNMEKEFSLVLREQDGLDITIHRITIRTTLSSKDIIPAVIAASKDYLNTPEGRETWERNHHSFNYGDFDLHVTNEFCIPHGFRRLDKSEFSIMDDFNRQLVPSETVFADIHKDKVFTVIPLGAPYPDVWMTNEDVDDLMESVMTGCTYWCDRAEPVDDYLGEYASEQISKGGSLKFFPSDDVPVELTPENFRNGLYEWLKTCVIPKRLEQVIPDGRLNPGQIDAEDGDTILQYALFGELVYGECQ